MRRFEVLALCAAVALFCGMGCGEDDDGTPSGQDAGITGPTDTASGDDGGPAADASDPSDASEPSDASDPSDGQPVDGSDPADAETLDDGGGCVPTTCAAFGAECGALDDGCGGVIDCGNCDAPWTCDGDLLCVCHPECVNVICGEKDLCGSVCEVGSGCCESACETEGAVQCQGDGVATCGDDNADPCLEWSDPVSCAPGLCLDGVCCTPDCALAICGDWDGCAGTCEPGSGCCEPDCADQPCGGDDGCGGACELGPDCCEPDCVGVPCGGADGCGGVCEAGSGCCVPSCVDTTCGDSDGCVGTCEPGSGCCEPDCAGKPCGESNGCDEICVAGSGCCEPECAGQPCGGTDGCGGTCALDSGCCADGCASAGQTVCEGTDQVKTCGDYDADACLEWSEPADCASGVCEGGACEDAPVVCTYPMAPTESIAGIGGGGGACNGDGLLTDDGQATELWSKEDYINDWLGVDVSMCRVVDFGQVCTPAEICVEAWAGEEGCSGDDCGGPCELCKGFATSLDIFAYEENSTFNFDYKFSMHVNATGDPGAVQCHSAGGDPIRYVLVCRSACGPSAMNTFVDYVYLN